MRIGVIAEDKSDVDVLYELTCKITEEADFSFKMFVGHGCGKLRRKCTAWAENLVRRGCSHLVVLHDLDNNIESELRAYLSSRVSDIGFDGYIILIPVREIESWLLTDALAIKSAFHMRKQPVLPGEPEKIMHPKEKLRDIVWNSTKKHYVNAIHNKKIASEIKIVRANKCQSFKPYPIFISTHIETRANNTLHRTRRARR